MDLRNRLGLAFISALGMPPVPFVKLAAKLGCGHVSMALAPMTANPCGFDAWSLRDDAYLRKQLVETLDGYGMSLSIGEVFLIRPGVDLLDSERDMEIFAELGARAVNGLSIEPDPARGLAQIGKFVEMAEKAGVSPTLEYMPGLPIGNLASAKDAVAQVGGDRLRLVIDCMHFIRAGDAPEALAACPAGLIGDLQLCDVPLRPQMPNYGEEALHHRMVPGEGELPLAQMVKAIPESATISLEVPMLARAEAGESPEDILGQAVRAAGALIKAQL